MSNVRRAFTPNLVHRHAQRAPAATIQIPWQTQAPGAARRVQAALTRRHRRQLVHHAWQGSMLWKAGLRALTALLIGTLQQRRQVAHGAILANCLLSLQLLQLTFATHVLRGSSRTLSTKVSATGDFRMQDICRSTPYVSVQRTSHRMQLATLCSVAFQRLNPSGQISLRYCCSKEMVHQRRILISGSFGMSKEAQLPSATASVRSTTRPL